MKILKPVLYNWIVMMRTGFISPETESASESCEHYNESSRSVEVGEILARWTAVIMSRIILRHDVSCNRVLQNCRDIPSKK
jgi:hypothetical protein